MENRFHTSEEKRKTAKRQYKKKKKEGEKSNLKIAFSAKTGL
jgi:hypothetical protein